MSCTVSICGYLLKLNPAWVRALELKAEVEGTTVENVLKVFAELVKELWEKCEYIDKFGRWKGTCVEKEGVKKIIVDDITEGMLELNFKEFIERCLYYYLRPYIFAAILSGEGKPGVIIVRDGEIVEINNKGIRKTKRLSK